MSDWKSIHLDDPSMWPTDVIVPLEAGHDDERGSIQPLYDLPTKSVVIISSKKGTVRANHYHLTDWHYCYVAEGEIDYYHRPHGSEDEPEMVTVKKGELFFTPPMVDHAMVFAEDSVFYTFGRNPRDQETYEADVRRITLVDPSTIG
ncbi:MAG: hypothetical protein VX930_00350 [Pseudomonadota bacterium]|nr:hypothetical protein [Pseudomonadota bacterium]